MISLVVHGFLFSGCLVSQRKSWAYTQLTSKTEITKPFIKINLEKETLWLPLPLFVWEISCSRNYLLDIDFHTKDVMYNHLDSISYKIRSVENLTLATGTLPIVNGELSRRLYSPEVHRAQCTTQPLIILGNQRQELTGDFVIYATDINNHKTTIPVDSVALHYFKARITSFF